MNHFTVYKIICLVNGKTYIGKHQTKDLNDSYMGSGKLIKAAIKKYGLENFKKDILYVFETEDEMNKKEAELVTEEFIASGSSYNLCPGGNGGFGYINANGLAFGKAGCRKGRIHANRILNDKHQARIKSDAEYRDRWLKALNEGNKRVLSKDCPICDKKNLNPGNFAIHMRKYH